MSKALSIRPSEFLDPYFEEDAITRFAIDLIVLVSDVEEHEREIPNIEEQTDSLRKRDLEFKRKYNITLEQAKKIVFGDRDGSGGR